MSTEDPELVALRFNEAINQKNLDKLIRLMTADHRFVDSENNCVRGREKLQVGWSKFFSKFPDYKNRLSAVLNREDGVFCVGHFRCSSPAVEGPAIWKAVVRRGRVAEWRVYEDSEQTRSQLGLVLDEAV